MSEHLDRAGEREALQREQDRLLEVLFGVMSSTLTQRECASALLALVDVRFDLRALDSAPSPTASSEPGGPSSPPDETAPSRAPTFEGLTRDQVRAAIDFARLHGWVAS